MYIAKQPGVTVLILAAASLAWPVSGQSPVKIGEGTIASTPPTYKAKTETDGSGFNATMMLSRKIYADELPGCQDGLLEVPGRAIPTNDWWTDIINNRYSGSLWSYPAMLRTSELGVEINYPTYWADQGKEIKSRTSLTVGAKNYRAESTIAKDWHDWDVVFRMPQNGGDGEITVTSMHGSPFSWFEFTGLTPEISFSETAETFEQTETCTGIRIGEDLYGLYYPSGHEPQTTDSGTLLFDDNTLWVVVALLRNENDLSCFDSYAVSIPRDTKVSWSYDDATATVNTKWNVTAQNLRDTNLSAPVLQGFLPHAYKYMLAGAALSFMDNDGFMTPRGTMKLAASPNGDYGYAYRFSGMLPTYGAPSEGNSASNGFRQEVLDKLMSDYAARGSFGGDTYWGGKGLVQMAMNMSFAKETGNIEVYEESKRRLKEAFKDWFTYTPGENNHFFSYYPRWGAMLGFDVSYDSDAFNDHHFHYGYFTYAAALLCLEDREFALQYGDLLTMVAKDYANWDREDARFPFMRTFDPWNGHSWAGGLGDHGNDNGNGQESTSEAMQSWGGLYLLGVALDNKQMRDAGIWGWSTEARATREYWYDIDSPRPTNAGGRKPWPGKGDKQGNYDYNEYPYAYNSNITGKGIGWWTWFGGDPLFMHGIQWMPVSPALDYLSWDKDFVGWALDDMMSGANSTFSHSWFETTTNSDNGEAIEPLAANDWGNVALSYLQRNDPEEAARVFDEALARGMHIATAVSTAHISYYVTHSHLTYGDPDFSIYADIPTAQVRVKDGVRTYIVYNPSDADRMVKFFDPSGTLVKTVIAPAQRLAAICGDPKATSIECNVTGGCILPPASEVKVNNRVLDQYGAAMPTEEVTLALSEGAPASLSGDILKINANAPLNSTFILTISAGELSENLTFTVNHRPEAELAVITGIPDICETRTPIEATLSVTDQYGIDSEPADVQWTCVMADGGEPRPVKMPFSIDRPGKYVIHAISSFMNATASKEVFVTPPTPLVSLRADVIASSAENTGTMPEGAVDGDLDVRWGSKHTDDEWLVVDLGEQCDLSRISVTWEAAYAERYLLQAAPDGCELTNVVVDYAGRTQKVNVPVETAWQTIKEETAVSAGEKTSVVTGAGRYIRLKGLQRGSAYGYSLYEISIFGLRHSIPEDGVIGVDFSLPEVMDCGETIDLNPIAFSRNGSKTFNPDIVWHSDKEAGFSGNRFTPASHGSYTLTAKTEEGGATSASVFVNEIERAVSVRLEKDEYTVIEGESAIIPYTVMNQFLAPYRGEGSQITIQIFDSEGTPVSYATYDSDTNIFTSSVCSTYNLDFGGMASCTVHVRPLSEVNLAQGKIATASSINGGNKASLAVDGETDTRWESRWEENQNLSVDLGKAYLIDRIIIYWEGAYAKEYRLQSSSDGETWFDFYKETDSHGGTERVSFAPVSLRHIRLCCDRRALPAYGVSLYEIEVYGNDLKSSVKDTGKCDADDDEIWFNLQGQKVIKPSQRGIYIRLTGNKAERIVIE